MAKLRVVSSMAIILVGGACSCDDSPRQVNQAVAALTPLPRLPSDLADELKHLQAIIEAAGTRTAPHLTLARSTFVDAYVDGMLMATAAGRSTAKLTALFSKASDHDLPGAKTLVTWIDADHPMHAFLSAVAMNPGVPRAETLKAMAMQEAGAGPQRARLLLALHFRRLLDASTHDIGSIVANYPYPCAASLNAIMRGDSPPANERAICPITCPAFKAPKEGKPRKIRQLLTKSCPPKSLGLRAPEEMRYAGPQLAPLRFALVHGEANLRRARKDGGPLGDAVRRALVELQGSLKNRPFPAPYPGWFGPGEFRTGVIMNFGSTLPGGRSPAAQRFITINRTGGLRTGIRPALAVDDQGIRFMDLESELAWPGRPVHTRADPLFPAPSGNHLKDAMMGLNMRAESLFEGAQKKPLMIVLSRGAPPRHVGRVLAELPKGTALELGYWDHGVKAVRAQVGWTRVRTEIANARDLELADETEESPTEAADGEKRAPKQGATGGQGDAGSQGAPGDAEAPQAEGASDAGEAMRLGHLGSVSLARKGTTSRVTISGKELLFNDLAGDAKLPLRGYASNKRSPTMVNWRKRLITMANLLPKEAKVMLYVRGDAPMDAVLELIGALAPRAVNLSFPHRRIEVLEDDLYAPPSP